MFFPQSELQDTEVQFISQTLYGVRYEQRANISSLHFSVDICVCC